MKASTPVKALEDAWCALLRDAGWTDILSGTPNWSIRRAYEARVDSLIAERETELRAMVESAKRDCKDFYVEGIESAIDRAIKSPRQP